MGDPTGFLKHQRSHGHRRPVELRTRDYKHVYDSTPRDEVQQQAGRCMDCGVPFCNNGCPLHNLIPEWNDLVFRNRWDEAIDRLHATNNFPEFTGLLCPAPCESACVLTINDEPVTIKEVENSIIDTAWQNDWVIPRPPATRTGRSVAVVGSGPSGLAAAQQLNRHGHSVTVYERDDAVGGLLRYGIPDFKIEKWVINRRIAQLEAEGITFVTNAHVGISPTYAQLRQQHDAVLLAVGALAGRELTVPGRELEGIHLAMDYLVQQNRRVAGLPVHTPTISAAGKRVVIIGGGDTGADCLGNAHREQCASVEVLTRGPQPPATASPLEWPNVPYVLREWPAHEEGGTRLFDLLIEGFSGSNGHVERVHLRHRESSEEMVIDADLVLLAVGFTGPVKDELFDELLLDTTPGGAISHKHFATNVPDVFVCGDAAQGASLVVTAIADGRMAAEAIHRHLQL